MTNLIMTRRAQLEQINWVNAQYDAVGFKHSLYENGHIAIAEFKGKRVGLGRLQHITEEVSELEGIFVKESHRGRGGAQHIAQYLLDHSHAYNIVYCISFSNLEQFYRQFGF